MTRWWAASVALSALACAGASAAPPPAGTLVFVSDRCDGGGVPVELLPGVNVCRSSVFRAAPDGSGLVRLTRGSSPEDEKANVGGDGAAAWAPDGELIAFTRSTTNGTRIFAMNGDGSNEHLLFAGVPSYGNASDPAWSPDGKTIAFTSSGGLESGVFAFDVATGAQHRVTPLSLYAQVPRFTPDGRVSFFADGTGNDSDSFDQRGIYSTQVDGTQLRRLTIGDIDVQAGGLAFSPAGGLAALATRAYARVYTLRRDGSGRVRRSRFDGAGQPAWAADGSLFWTGPAQTTGIRPAPLYRLTAGAKGTGTAITTPNGLSTDSLPAPYGAPAAAVADKQAPGAIVEVDGGGVHFLAFDQSGIARIDAAICRKANKRCNAKPAFHRIKNVSAWQSRSKKLGKGSYRVRFKLRDVLGNATKTPRALSFRLR